MGRSGTALLVVVMLLAAGRLGAQEAKPKVEAGDPGPALVAEAWVEVSGETSVLGDEVEYHVKVEAPAGAQLDVPGDMKLGDGAWIIRERVSILRKPLESGKEELKLVVPFRLVRVGRVKIPAQEFALLLPDGSRQSISVGVVRLRTGTLFPNENSPEPGQAEAPVPVKETNWLLIWALVVLGVVGATVLLTLSLRRRLAKLVVKPAPPPRPAHEVAFERLEKLAGEAWPNKGEYMHFYVDISEILREYIGSRWRFDSLDRTTTELMNLMRNKELKNYDFERLQYMLDDFDLVKFAKVVPTLEQTDGDFARVRKFVETTMESAAPVVEAGK